MRRLRAILGIVALQSVIPGGVSSTAEAAAEQHCVVTVVGQAPNGMLITTPEVCFPTASEARASLGEAGASSFALGVHYDGTSGSGSTLTVNGDDCTGGWLNLSSTWVNRISSTRNGCPRIRHFDGNNLSGSAEDTWTVGAITNLSGLNNATNSIQYL